MQVKTQIAILLFILPVLARQSAAQGDGWGMLSGELREVRELLKDREQRYAALGPYQLRQTVAQAGGQMNMKNAPPPQAPWVQLDLGKVQQFNYIMIVPAIIGEAKEAFEPYAFPRRLRVDVSDSVDFDAFDLLYDSAVENLDAQNPLPLVIATPGTRSRYVRITVTELAEVTGRRTFALSEVMVVRGDRNVALDSDVSMTDSAELPPVWRRSFLVDGNTPLGPPLVPAGSSQQLPNADGVFLMTEEASDEPWFQIDLEQAATFDAVRLFSVHARLGADFPGYAFPRRFRIEASDDLLFEKSNVLFQTEDDFENPGSNPATIQFDKSVSARYVRVVSERGARATPTKIGFAEVQVLHESVNLAADKPVTALHWKEDRPLSILVDGDASYGKIDTLSDWADRWKSARSLRKEILLAEMDAARLVSVAQRRAMWMCAGLLFVAVGGLVAFSRKRRRLHTHRQAAFRMQLAQDLHDEIGSNLAAIARIGEVGEAIVKDEELKEDWQSVRELAGECTDSIQETLWLLGGPKRHGECLGEQLRSIATRMLPDLEIRWKTESEFHELRLGDEPEREIVLVFKAVLANIAKNSNATRVQISAQKENGRWLLCVEDNGDGFDAAEWENGMDAKGMGLESMRQRMHRLGGTVAVESEKGHGVRVMIALPS